MGRTSFDKKLKKTAIYIKLTSFDAEIGASKKNRIISAMSGQFQSELPIFKTNRNTNRDLEDVNEQHEENKRRN